MNKNSELKNQNHTMITSSPGILGEIIKNKTLYIMTLPGVILLFLFNYLPLAGILVAFKDFKYIDGIFKSPWMKPIYKNFEFFFTSEQFWRLTRNTLLLNFGFIVFGTLLAVGVAIMLNEIEFIKLKKVMQAGILMPYFISWIVVGVFIFALFNYDYGTVNGLLKLAGLQPIDWYSTYQVWPIILIALNIWKNVGYSSVIYLASLAGIDNAYYEAAKIDGATKMQQICHISIPHILPTVTTMTLLSIGRIMNADFGMFYAIVGENSILYPTADVIDTYIYRTLRKLGDVGMSSAVGFYQSMVAFFLVIISNKVARKYQKEGSIF